MTNRFVNPKSQYADGDNVLLPGGQLFFFVSGTSTLKDTFKDPDKNEKNTNPVILGADARVPDIFLDDDQQYKVILRTPGTSFNPEGVQIWEVDPYGPQTGTGQLESWTPSRTYDTGDYVRASDGNLYEAIQPSTGRDPTTEPEFWSEVFFNKIWNTNETYDVGDVVFHEGREYRSEAGGNTGNNPLTSNTWMALVFEADGIIPSNPSITFDGYGVSSITRPSAGTIRVEFLKPASGTFDQSVVALPYTGSSSDIYAVTIQPVNATTVDIFTWFVNGLTGEYTSQDNLTRITIRRNLL